MTMTWPKLALVELRHRRQVEARAAGADIGRVEGDVVVLAQPLLELAHFGGRSRPTRRPAPASGRRSARDGWRSGRTASAPGRSAPIEATKASAVMAIVVLRQVTHRTTSLRKVGVEAAAIGIVMVDLGLSAAGGSPSTA